METALHRAQGWYRDPFGNHQDRYFSVGTPTELVRDQTVESYDPPPPGQWVALPVAPAAMAPTAQWVDNMRRADDLQRTPAHDVFRKVIDTLSRCVGSD